MNTEHLIIPVFVYVLGLFCKQQINAFCGVLFDTSGIFFLLTRGLSY